MTRPSISRFARLAALVGIALLATGAAPRAWNLAVSQTDGGHRIGNPDAKVKLTEYVSYTCSHCADFARESDGALQLGYVIPGKVSVEVRHIVRDPVDLTAAMLANCGPAEKFARNHTAFMFGQDKWIAPLSTASSAQRQRWTSGDPAARRRAIAADFGFYRIMEGRGYTRIQADRCLADEALAKRLAETSARDLDDKRIPGTPSFAIDGVVLTGTHTWAVLRPQIDARL